MIQSFELQYAALVREILQYGEQRETRNATTRSVFGRSITIDMKVPGQFPLLVGRKLFTQGVLGELAAIFRQPKHINDFRKWGCNYWEKWAKEDGSINIDYGNAWFVGNQIARLKANLRGNPTDRRMLIMGWRPENLDKLDLPCCHYGYQFYVREGKYIDMIWSQRSVDVMIGLPADIILAYTWLIMLANEFGYLPGRVKMDFGDTHIYKSHVDNAYVYLKNVDKAMNNAWPTPSFVLNCKVGKNFLDFEPSDISIIGYTPIEKLEFELYE